MRKSKLKIMSLAMASLLGMSSFGQLTANAMLRRLFGKGSTGVTAAAPAAESKEELIRQLPGLWQEYWDADIAARGAIDAGSAAALASSKAELSALCADLSGLHSEAAAKSDSETTTESDSDAHAAIGVTMDVDAYDAARDTYEAACFAIMDAAGHDAYDNAHASAKAIAKAAAKAAGIAVCKGPDIYNKAFVEAWQPGGAAYLVVKNKSVDYVIKLAKILREQTQKINEAAQRARDAVRK